MTWQIPLSAGKHLSVINAYAPTLVADRAVSDRFNSLLDDKLGRVPRHDKLILLGDFNERVGRAAHIWTGVLGNHGVGNSNSNDLQLLSLCAEHGLVIRNTLFQLRNMHNLSWMHPRSKKCHLLDYVIVKQSDIQDVLITRVMRGADGLMDGQTIAWLGLCCR